MPEAVRIEDYGAIRPAAARVRRLREAGGDRLEVRAPVVSDGTYRGRLAIDLPRRLARRLALPVAEPGDRGDVHAFFDEESILLEAARAGYRFVERRGAWVVLERGPPPVEHAESFASELARAVRVFRKAEHWRNASPAEAVRNMRHLGRRAKARGPIGRSRLRRAIGWLDFAHPHPNCFRRVLMELALDRGAAASTLVFGLDVGTTGHVAFKDSEERRFDVLFEIGP